ncbi:pilus assembly protein PilP [Acinetobacter gerneri]|uniref:pilus assembly protein PilP n=1 Tax=Acinetobacter gerneri TaxID=202952 RepID=UPI003214D725
MKMIQISLLLLITTSLLACTSKIEYVAKKMDEIQHDAPQSIPPEPVFETAPSYSYAAQQLRSPFLPSSVAQELKVLAGKRVTPNPNRQKQYLEQFPLDNLNMKGTFRNRAGVSFALIQTPTGQVERIQVGDYLGLNQGRVIHIEPKRVDLLEIMLDGHDHFIERPRSLVLLVAP